MKKMEEKWKLVDPRNEVEESEEECHTCLEEEEEIIEGEPWENIMAS